MYARWVSNQDPATPRVAYSATAVALCLLVIVCTLGACRWIPGLAATLRVDTTAGALLCLPWLGWYGVMRLRGVHQQLDLHGMMWMVLVGNTLVLVQVGALMGLSALAGALLFALFYLNASSLFGYLYRITPAEPLGVLSPVLAAGVAWALATTPEQVAVISAAALSGVGSMLFLGRIGLEHQRAVTGRAAAMAALHAQVMHDRSTQLDRTRELLTAELGRGHDVNNQLGALDFNLVALRDHLSGKTGGTPADAVAILDDLAESVQRVQRLNQESRGAARGHLTATNPVVAVGKVAEGAVRNVARRHHGVRFDVQVPAELRVQVVGGETTLDRILFNLVQNACQGDGRRGATEVNVRARLDGSAPMVELEIEDNGPGFPPALVAAPAQGFHTTKKDGSGLGLYTCERLTWASGGQLLRRNTPGGGARVVVTLPRA
ncbi:MAG: HAMP domain-containing histidine kinase [Deltaproteobacteria bacterium]|nr:HAMP domain-containing histidine kinase [Deltaproteobacteria bacterium]